MTTNIVQTNQFVNMIDADEQTVLAIDSGKTFLIPIQTAPCEITLPLPKPGLNYRFMINGATAGTVGADTITFSPSGAGVVTGMCLNITPGVAGAVVVAAVTKNNAAAGIDIEAAAPRGTWLNMNCNGSVWYINGVSNDVGFS